jgi:hypothetical protein
MFPDAGHAHSSLVFFIHAFRFGIHESIHGVLLWTSGGFSASFSIVIFAGIAPHAGAAAGATALAFVVACQGIAPSESAPALGADMRPLAGMEFRVSLQIVEPAEPGLARLTHVWLLLAVGQQVAFEVMMPRKLGGTERTSVLLRGR